VPIDGARHIFTVMMRLLIPMPNGGVTSFFPQLLRALSPTLKTGEVL
jgi:hypothetical protein